MLPMAVSGSGVLSRLTLGLMNEIDSDAWLANGLSIGVFFAFCSAVFYLTFVIAPTAITERSGRWSEWTIRYLVYVATLAIGVAWLRSMT